MSSSSQDKRVAVLGELTRELRQFGGLGASFFRAAATRVGMTVTDMQVIDILENTGPATAGQLAELTGLTTGAVTGMLNRLEEAGLVQRERDPSDGRRVIVQLVKEKDEMREISSTLASLGHVWGEVAERYTNEQLASFVEFLRQGNVSVRQEIMRLRETPPDEEGFYSLPLEGLESARLVVTGASRLTLRAVRSTADLYRARFGGVVPDVKIKERTVSLRYPRRLWKLGGEQREAEITLNAGVSWWIVVQAGASEIRAELDGLNLAGLEVNGGANMVRVELPVPSGIVPIKISGGASDIEVRRPEGVAARVHLKGWVSEFIFDDQSFNNLGNDVRLQSSDDAADAPYYNIDVFSSASMARITTG